MVNDLHACFLLDLNKREKGSACMMVNYIGGSGSSIAPNAIIRCLCAVVLSNLI